MTNLQQNLAGPLRYTGILLAMLVLAALASTTRSQASDHSHDHNHDHMESHRSLGAHVHGLAQLLVAVDGEHLHITLQTPAVNVVGFEHNAVTEAEREQLAAVQRHLMDAGRVAIPSPSASCELETAEVMSTQLDALHDHSHDAHDHEHDGDYHGEHTHRTQTGSHSEFEVVYRFHCSNPGGLHGLSVTVFEHFPGFDAVNVQWVGARGQGAARVESAQAVVRF